MKIFNLRLRRFTLRQLNYPSSYSHMARAKVAWEELPDGVRLGWNSFSDFLDDQIEVWDRAWMSLHGRSAAFGFRVERN